MSQRSSRLDISGQFLHCPLFVSVDTYEGCTFGCRYCLIKTQYDRQNRGKHRRESIRPTLLGSWEKVLDGKSIGNPMIEYLVGRRHPVQLGTRADPFPQEIEEKVQNTHRFLKLCNAVNYPVYITTKNTIDLPIDLLADGNYILAVSLASHRDEHIRALEMNTSGPRKRIGAIPPGVFKKVVIRWQPFIPKLFWSRGKKTFSQGQINHFLDLISSQAHAVSISYLNWSGVRDSEVLEVVGEDDLDDLDVIEMFTYIKEQAHLRGMEFYTANYRALSDSPVCCGLRGDEFEISTRWVWAYLIWKLFSNEKEYLTVEDLREAFPDDLKNATFSSMDVPLFSRWARYTAKRTTILDEYIRNFTFDRRLNPANFFAGLYSKVVDGEYRIYFMDYRTQVSTPQEGALHEGQQWNLGCEMP